MQRGKDCVYRTFVDYSPVCLTLRGNHIWAVKTDVRIHSIFFLSKNSVSASYKACPLETVHWRFFYTVLLTDGDSNLDDITLR